MEIDRQKKRQIEILREERATFVCARLRVCARVHIYVSAYMYVYIYNIVLYFIYPNDTIPPRIPTAFQVIEEHNLARSDNFDHTAFIQEHQRSRHHK